MARYVVSLRGIDRVLPSSDGRQKKFQMNDGTEAKTGFDDRRLDALDLLRSEIIREKRDREKNNIVCGASRPMVRAKQYK